jgi:hypothetical protein
MRLSDLVDSYGHLDPIISVIDHDGIPVDPDDIETGMVLLDSGPYPYIAFEIPDNT